jgi:hypothetical protein
MVKVRVGDVLKTVGSYRTRDAAREAYWQARLT